MQGCAARRVFRPHAWLGPLCDAFCSLAPPTFLLVSVSPAPQFIGASTKEFSYLRGFMINQPMPSIIGRLLYHLPLGVHKLSLAVFFLSEIVVPFFFFGQGAWRVGAGLITMGLMGLIWSTGNFGFFNFLAASLCIPLMDGGASLFGNSESFLDAAFNHGMGNSIVHVVLILQVTFALAFLPFNSWCTMSFFLWPGLSLSLGSVEANPLAKLLRRLAPWHMVHAFGVFFPHSSAGVRWIPIIEGTDDERANTLEEERVKRGVTGGTGAAGAEEVVDPAASCNSALDSLTWRQYEYKFMTTTTSRMPPFCAPWHQRLDQAILYESIGMTPETFLATLSSGNRYEFSPIRGSSMLSRVCACLLQDNADVEGLFKTTPFSGSGKGGKRKVQALRISFYLFSPTSLGELASTGQFWHKRYVGLHVPLITRRMVESSLSSHAQLGCARDNYGKLQVREPECSHPEHYISACAAPPLERLHARLDAALAAGSPLDSAALIATDSSVSSSNTDPSTQGLVLSISPAQVTSELWGPTGFVASIAPLFAKLSRPAPVAGSKEDLSIPQSDFEHHLPAGEWSAAVTAFLSSSSNPLSRLDALGSARLEKMLARAVLLLVRRMLPFYHGPGPDEMTTTAQISAAFTPDARGHIAGKTGRYCLRPCVRDSCRDASHLHLPSFMHLHLLAQHIILQGGRQTFDAVLASPSSAAGFVRGFSLATGLLPQALWHGGMLAFHAAKIRMIVKISFPYQLEFSSILPGFLSIYYNFVSREYATRNQGAFSPVQHLPRISAPVAADQFWVVDHSNMDVVNARGLVVEEGASQASGTGQTNGKNGGKKKN